MKVSSRVIRSWYQLELPSGLDNSSTECIVSKIGLLVKHIEAFREELAKASAMGLDLEQLLEAQLSIIKKKNLEVT